MSATDVESANLLTVSTALVRAATLRRESRGTHTRADHPESSSEFLGHLVFGAAPTPEFVPLAASEPV
jgi:L-aspartate oxidase